MPEPEQLKRGKQFQKIVQEDFEKNSKDGKVISGAFVSFNGLKEIKQKSGRMDIFIKELRDFVTIVEIKTTDWNKINPENKYLTDKYGVPYYWFTEVKSENG